METRSKTRSKEVVTVDVHEEIERLMNSDEEINEQDTEINVEREAAGAEDATGVDNVALAVRDAVRLALADLCLTKEEVELRVGGKQIVRAVKAEVESESDDEQVKKPVKVKKKAKSAIEETSAEEEEIKPDTKVKAKKELYGDSKLLQEVCCWFQHNRCPIT